jgi:hypothetical protein
MRYFKVTLTIVLLFAGMLSFGQTPDLYPPTVPEPIGFSLYNAVLYILLPLGIIVAFFVYGYSQKKKKQERKERKDKMQDKNSANTNVN